MKVKSLTHVARIGIAAAAVALMLAGVTSLAADEDAASPAAGKRFVRVQGEARLEVEPDQARLTFGVQTDAATSREALEQNSTAMDRVLQSLKQAGIAEKDIQTSQLSVYPRYNYPQFPNEGGRESISGYTAVNTVMVRTGRLDDLGRLIDIAVQAGANRVEGVSFSVADPESVYRQALRQAVDIARQRGETLARAGNARMGKVLSLETGGTPVVIPFEAAMRADGAADAAIATPLQPGKIRTEAQVTVTWELLD